MVFSIDFSGRCGPGVVYPLVVFHNGGRRCRYCEVVEVRVGRSTLQVWPYVQLYYRYRQTRWRCLARVLGRGHGG